MGRSEWFVFRRYAEFDKLYNTVSNSLQDFYLKHLRKLEAEGIIWWLNNTYVYIRQAEKRFFKIILILECLLKRVREDFR